jgi:hypothetical protein
MSVWFRPLLQAMVRTRWFVGTLALTYILSVCAGILLVHSGNESALAVRDALVARAYASDPAAIALAQHNRLGAVLWDFGRNLLLGGIPSTVGGLAIVIPYPVAAYRGWVGGIVSVDQAHSSRLKDPAEAFYYLVTLVLQLIPYSLAGGAGVYLGVAYLHRSRFAPDQRWHGFPKEALRDVGWHYLLIIPLFFVASLREFLAR